VRDACRQVSNVSKKAACHHLPIKIVPDCNKYFAKRNTLDREIISRICPKNKKAAHSPYREMRGSNLIV